MMKLRRSGVLVLLAPLLLLGSVAAQEWTRFRGPNGSGVSDAKGVPVTWTEKDFRWRVPIAGESHCQPVIEGDHIFLTSAVNEGRERMILCLQKSDGKELWSKKVPMATNAKNKLNSFASSSPVVDKERVYATFVSADQFLVKAFDLTGKELWTENLGAFKSQHGHAASPVLFQDRLILTNDQDGESFVVSLDAKTGKTVWKSSRRGGDQTTAYGTPAILEHKGGPTEILTSSLTHGISSLDFKTGAPLWEAKVFDKRAVSSPLIAGDLVIGTCGQGGGGSCLAAVRIGGKGDVTSSNVAYTIKQAVPYVPTPVAVGNRLFWISDGGVASCAELATGKVLWSERVADKGPFYGSPVAIDGKLYIVSGRGELYVIAAADEYKMIAKNPLGEASHSTPCVDGDRLYIKTFTHLVCVGGK